VAADKKYRNLEQGKAGVDKRREVQYIVHKEPEPWTP
jgi:hypothetical protein